MIFFLNKWRWKYWNHVKWHIKTHLQKFSIERNNMSRRSKVIGHVNSTSADWPSSLAILPKTPEVTVSDANCPLTIFQNQKKVELNYFENLCPFPNKPSFIRFVTWDAICLSVTLQLTTVRGVFLFSEKKPMLSAVRNNRESGVASRLKLKLADEATKQMKWNNQMLMLPKKSKHGYTSESYVSALSTIHLFSLNTKQPKSTRTKVSKLDVVVALTRYIIANKQTHNLCFMFRTLLRCPSQ